MYNDSEKISAGEINKFTCCPYQWYYERLYGRKFIFEELKKTNPNYVAATKNKFSRGNRFHKYFRMKYKLRRLIWIIILTAIILFGVCYVNYLGIDNFLENIFYR